MSLYHVLCQYAQFFRGQGRDSGPDLFVTVLVSDTCPALLHWPGHSRGMDTGPQKASEPGPTTHRQRLGRDGCRRAPPWFRNKLQPIDKLAPMDI
jgi:hypothetical protein